MDLAQSHQAALRGIHRPAPFGVPHCKNGEKVPRSSCPAACSEAPKPFSWTQWDNFWDEPPEALWFVPRADCAAPAGAAGRFRCHRVVHRVSAEAVVARRTRVGWIRVGSSDFPRVRLLGLHFWPTADVPLRTCSESLPRLHHLGLTCCCEVGWSSEERQCSAGCVLRAYGRHSPLNPPRSSPSRWGTSSSASCRSRASASTRPTGEPSRTPTHAPLEPACTITSQQHGISGLSVDLQFREARFCWVQRAAAVARLDTMRRLAAGVPSRATATAWAAATTLAWATT
jgi:hypothetical protein